jgi:hypothetical protein
VGNRKVENKVEYERYETKHVATYHEVVYRVEPMVVGSIESVIDVSSLRHELRMESLVTYYKMLDIIMSEPFYVTAVNAYHPPVLVSRYSAFGYVDLSAINMDEREHFLAASDYQVWMMDNADIDMLNQQYLARYSIYIDRLRHHKDSYFLMPPTEHKRIENAIDNSREKYGLVGNGEKWRDLIVSVSHPDQYGPDRIPF